MLKLVLMCRRERFGCDVSYQGFLTSENELTKSISDLDGYVGKLARAEIYLQSEEPKQG
jgi:hypothetical protein